MTTQATLREIPLSQLRLSPRNTRRSRSPESIESMAASLAAHGLIQNLTVEPCNDDADAFEVLAGGTRLCALQLRAGRKEIAPDLPVMCRIVVNGEAVETSAAENLIRTRLSPAEEYDAFRAMADAGKSVADIAAHFGVGEIVVKRSLKLANVDPQLFMIFREGGMRLDQLQALALTDDHDAQRKVWFVKNLNMQHAHNIRDALTKREVGPDNPLVKFVGADAYEQAGGPVRRDLFSEQVYFGDKALLDKLALDKLDAEAERRRAEGWSWVEAFLTLDYEGQARYPSSGIEPKHAKPSSADKARIKDLDAEISALEARMEAIDEEDADTDWETLDEKRQELWAERRELNAGSQIWSDEAKAKTGVLIWIDRYDGMRVACGRLKPGQRKIPGGDIGGTAKGKAEAQPKKPELSAALLMALSAHRSAAAAHHVARDPMLATCVLIDRMLHTLWADHGGGSASRIEWRGDRGHTQIAPDIDKALLEPLQKARKALDQIPKRDTLPWLLQQTEDFQQSTLATLVALSIDGITESTKGHSGIDHIHQAVGIDMAKHWTPTCDGFLSRIAAALVVEAVTEARGKESASVIASAKGKEGRSTEAAKLLAGSGWLPKPMRGAGYNLASTSKPAVVASPAKPAKKSAAKKAAKPAKKAVKAPVKKATRR